MEVLTLTKKILVLEIKKKTGAEFWKNIETGDVLNFEYGIEWGYGDRKERIRIRNERTKEILNGTSNQIARHIVNLDFEEIV